MELKLKCGASRDSRPILAALEAANVQLDSVVGEQSSPEWLELQAAGVLDFRRLDKAVKTMCGALCPDESTVPIRIVREADMFDLLYFIPCDDWERSAAALEVDIRRHADPEDSFRSWFRGEWMGQRDEDALTVEELSSEPLLPARILAYLDPPVFRDWRPIFSFIERHATCDQLTGAMANAQTPTQKWKLAYAFTADVALV